MNFIDRQEEMGYLDKCYNSGKAEFLVVYGKRRVGKTELLKHFVADRNAIYFLSDKRDHKAQLRDLSFAFADQFNDDFLYENYFENWYEAFYYIRDRVKKRFALVIDEYPYLTDSDHATSSIFQKGWDEILKNTKVMLILAGSSIAMMESEVLHYKSPLYGRRTGQILLQPMHLKYAEEFFPNISFEKFIEFYTILGGIPAYLSKFDQKLSLKKNIILNVLDKNSFLHREVEFVLEQEFRSPKTYFSLLQAISLGKTKFSEIASSVNSESPTNLPKYLGVLENLLIINKEFPVTEDRTLKSKKGLYFISENFFKFWLKYLLPFRSDLEIGIYKRALVKIRKEFKYDVCKSYEKFAIEFVRYNLDFFTITRIGRWWNNDTEIDVVALDEENNQILFGEAKWSNRPVGINVYLELKEKSTKVEWNYETRKEKFILFSKSGFTPEMKKVAKRENVLLVDKNKFEVL